MALIRFVCNARWPVAILLICISNGLARAGDSETPRSHDGTNSAPLSKKPSTSTSLPGTEEAAKGFLSEFLKPNADHLALSKRLRPTKDDYLAVFEAEFAKQAELTYTPAWDGDQIVIAPKSAQVELLLHFATTEDLKKWTEKASQQFPGGYQRVASKFKDGLTIYAFKFVKPGETAGTAYNGLVYVNGNWRIFPKPWGVN